MSLDADVSCARNDPLFDYYPFLVYYLLHSLDHFRQCCTIKIPSTQQQETRLTTRSPIYLHRKASYRSGGETVGTKIKYTPKILKLEKKYMNDWIARYWGVWKLNVFVLMAQYFLVCVYTQQHVDVCIQNDRHRIQIFSGRRALIFFCGLRWFSPPMNSAIAYRELQPMAAHTQTFACLYIHTHRERVATVMRGHTGPPTSARSRRSNRVILFVSYIMRRSPAVGWVIEKKRDVLI